MLADKQPLLLLQEQRGNWKSLVVPFVGAYPDASVTVRTAEIPRRVEMMGQRKTAYFTAPL